MTVENLLLEKGRDYFYIMHLSYDGRERRRLWNFARRENLIGLSYPDIVDNDWVKIREVVKDVLPNIWVRQFDAFCNEMSVGDIVLLLNGWNSLLGIAKITKQRHQYNRDLSHRAVDPFFDHIREVHWITSHEYDHRVTLPEPIKGFNNTLSKIETSTKRWAILKNVEL